MLFTPLSLRWLEDSLIYAAAPSLRGKVNTARRRGRRGIVCHNVGALTRSLRHSAIRVGCVRASKTQPLSSPTYRVLKTKHTSNNKGMDAETYNEAAGRIDDLRRQMETMYPDERITVMQELMRGYCMNCGDESHGRVCDCMRDDRLS